MLRKMPFILLLTILGVVFVNPMLPLEIKQAIYALSLTIKSLIIFLLPLIIFSLLFKTMLVLSRGATAVIGLILLCVCFSNALSTFLSHYVGEWIYQFDLTLTLPGDAEALQPAWQLQLPKLIANDKSMFAGILLGIVLGFAKVPMAHQLAEVLEKLTAVILRSITYVIPLFVAGFVVKLQHDGVMQTIVKDYAIIFVYIALAQFSYILLAYAILARFKFQAFITSIRNMLPAAIAGFSTMSSAAAMPLTINGVEQNTKNKELARSVVPATVNIHLIGDCFAIPIFAYVVMKGFGVAEPSLFVYLQFVFYFVIAKFSVAAIPGGGIVVMLPILESYLGFNGEMLSLITALYILFDPVITCANVLGNGAFAKLIEGIYQSVLSSKLVYNDKID